MRRMCPDRRKFATQLVKAPLVLALTEAASAHVHACAENMASKSRKGRFAFLQQQESALNIAFCIASAVALLNTKEISPPGHRAVRIPAFPRMQGGSWMHTDSILRRCSS